MFDLDGSSDFWFYHDVVLLRKKALVGVAGAKSKVCAAEWVESLKDLRIKTLALGAEHSLALSGTTLFLSVECV
jgi:hypothetical protein